MAVTYKIVIRCPKTGKVLETGIRTSGREALNSNLWQDGELSCCYCSQLHYFGRDAFLEMDQIREGDTLWRPNA